MPTRLLRRFAPFLAFLCLGLLVCCSAATGPAGLGPSGAMNGPELTETGGDNNPAKTPPLSIPAPVPRGDPPDADRETPTCHSTVQFKISLKPILHLDCKQLSAAVGTKAPLVALSLSEGEIEATATTTIKLETQCGSDGLWETSELKLGGQATLSDGCGISLKAKAVSPTNPDAEGPELDVEDFKNNESKEVSLQFP